MSTISKDLVPANLKGKPSDLEFSVKMASLPEAGDMFNCAAKRLLDPPLWHDLAGWASARFQLVGTDGEPLSRLAREGDYLRIDVPGPGPSKGNGYDWVRIVRVEEHLDPEGDQEWIGMKVHPCAAPGNTGLAAAHFFHDDASSTFIIWRNGNNVTAQYHGRNEVPNTSTGHPLDNIRNAVVAAGAMISFSEAQWNALSKGFLTAKNEVVR